jgi:hypothetical protein
MCPSRLDYKRFDQRLYAHTGHGGRQQKRILFEGKLVEGATAIDEGCVNMCPCEVRFSVDGCADPLLLPAPMPTKILKRGRKSRRRMSRPLHWHCVHLPSEAVRWEPAQRVGGTQRIPCMRILARTVPRWRRWDKSGTRRARGVAKIGSVRSADYWQSCDGCWQSPSKRHSCGRASSHTSMARIIRTKSKCASRWAGRRSLLPPPTLAPFCSAVTA